MKNQTTLYAVIGAGALIAGALAYFFLTRDGKEQLKKQSARPGFGSREQKNRDT